jgi:hypothetical protein
VTTVADFAPLERAIEHALATDDPRGLHVIGWGEITPVLAWPDADGPWACKRLPLFHDPDRLAAYRTCLDEYLELLGRLGVRVHDTRVEIVPKVDGVAAFIVQPAIPADQLAPAVLRRSTVDDGRALLAEVVTHVARVVSSTVGLDAQLSNWACLDGELTYFDVSTPMLRDDAGHDRLDTDLFISSLPAFVRPVVRRFLLSSLLDQFFEPRATALDLAANLYKERLGHWVPAAVEIANARLGLTTPLTEDEAQAYYRRDMRVWGALQTLRRFDRTWQRRVRRRPYRFLLPGRINRSL